MRVLNDNKSKFSATEHKELISLSTLNDIRTFARKTMYRLKLDIIECMTAQT